MLQSLQVQATRLLARRMQQLRHWKRLFSANLLLVNTGTCCTLYAVGDLCQQRIERKEKFDWVRTGRMAVLGFCLGPVNHCWYRALDKFLPGNTSRIVAQKVLLDQLVMAPLCCSLFYIGEIPEHSNVYQCHLFTDTGMSSLEGRTREEAVAELRAKFWPTYKVSLHYFPHSRHTVYLSHVTPTPILPPLSLCRWIGKYGRLLKPLTSSLYLRLCESLTSIL